jgi:hypothetical protein
VKISEVVMVAVEDEVIREGGESMACPEGQGTGIVNRWSEFAYFEDRRFCRVCDAGKQVEKKIAEIIARAQSDEQAGLNTHRPK